MTTTIRPVRILERGASKEEADFVVIWYHGFGADGRDCAPIADVLREMGVSNRIRYLFPEADQRPCEIVDVLGNPPSWYDYVSWFPTVKVPETVDQAIRGVLETVDDVVKSGIHVERIVLAGFSQGGALAVDTAVTSNLPFAGVIALSCDFPLLYPSRVSRAFDMFFGHGTADPMVPLAWKSESVAELRGAGHRVTERHYHGLGHGIAREELRDVAQYLTALHRRALGIED